MMPNESLPPAYERADAAPKPLLGCAGQSLARIMADAERQHMAERASALEAENAAMPAPAACRPSSSEAP